MAEVAGASIVGVVRGEPDARLNRMIAACESQTWSGPIELVLAAPPDEVETTERLLVGWSRGTVRVVPNPGGRRTPGLNRAVDAASGAVVVRVDARSVVPPDYVQLVVERLQSDSSVGVVGGVQWSTPTPSAGTVARGIALALRNRWLLGGAAYRRPGNSGPVDTVYLGAFRREELVALRYDESLDANEDYELCQRYAAIGRTVWLERDLIIGYEPRGSYRGLSAQYDAFGRAKVDMWRQSNGRPNLRQTVALGLVGLAGMVGVSQLRHPRRLVAVVAATGAVYASTDLATEADSAGVAVRAASVAAHFVIHISWVAGIARGLAGPNPQRNPTS